MITLEGNEATASIAHRVSEVIAIYPITPSSGMGELADQWSAEGNRNIWGQIPQVVEMQSEGGAAGSVHGALQTGALTTTFTASQGLLLMIPNMYKIAGELTSVVFHVAARSLAAQGLSIFGDHSDVMATRATGWAMLAACSVQEAHDFALIAHAATLKSRVPFIHFFDGFRTSHEINKIAFLEDAVLQAMIDNDLVQAHRARGLNPDAPTLRGTAQNPDVYFQARESCNPYYLACPALVQETMDQFAALTGRQYHIFDYVGDPEAERVVVIMGSGAETVRETIAVLNAQGEKLGAVIVRLFRPFDTAALMQALPATTRAIAVLDRTKEPGSVGEPLWQDISSAIMEHVMDGTAPFATLPRVIGGRYGLSSKEFTPAMIKAVYAELKKSQPKNHFTIGIHDDVTHTSLEYDADWMIEPDDVVRAVFYGLGADGTVGANKNSIKIIGENTDNAAQAYFVYDSKKSGAVTVSHLRFGKRPIHSTYLISRANFVACSQFHFLERFDLLRIAAPGATFLLNSPYNTDEVWDHLPRSVQETIIEKQIHFYVVNAHAVAELAKLGQRTNTVMQTCFFALLDRITGEPLMTRDEAIHAIKYAIEKTYGKRGEAIVQQNFAAVDASVAHLAKVQVPAVATSQHERPAVVSDQAPDFIKSVTARMIEGLGDVLPVSALPVDGVWPTGTTQWEKRNIATEIPVWDPDVCIQCGKCVFVCPHAVIRQKVYEPDVLADAPETFKSADARYKEFKGMAFTLQVAPEDCTGCSLCVEVCPAKNKRQPRFKAINMMPQEPLREPERDNWEFFLGLPTVNRADIPLGQIKYNQLLDPLFEFSGACAGCGETPYLKLLSQLFGERMLVANATGCSSIYGGNLPTTPWSQNADGRGPAWANSLFEDNAEFGLGMRIALDQRLEAATHLLNKHAAVIGEELALSLIHAEQLNEADIAAQRERVAQLQARLAELGSSGNLNGASADLANLATIAEVLVKKSVWIVGGDGWAYDIGFGGLDHVIASGRDVNLLVMDTEVYSNTGGQMSKATPRAAVAKFAAAGKAQPKKDLAMMALNYGNVYVARIAFGANDRQTVRAIMEAEAYEGPSLIIAYSSCIAHGYDLKYSLEQQDMAVKTGYWPLFRYHPEGADGQKLFELDSKDPSEALEKYMYREGRFRMLTQSDPVSAERLFKLAQADVTNRWEIYRKLAQS
jgi:pyruvate-ferredoxin/flavodoxin oxidoreductase